MMNFQFEGLIPRKSILTHFHGKITYPIKQYKAQMTQRQLLVTKVTINKT